jgi:hypothetical protein
MGTNTLPEVPRYTLRLGILLRSLKGGDGDCERKQEELSMWKNNTILFTGGVR